MVMSEMVEKVEGEVQRLTKSMHEALDTQNNEIKEFGSSSVKTAKMVDDLDKAFQQLAADMNGLKGGIEDIAKKMNRPGFGSAESDEESASIGQRFAKSDVYKRFIDTKQTKSDVYDTKHIFRDRQFKAIDGTSEGALRDVFSTMRLQEMFLKPHRKVRVRDIVPVIPTRAGAIEFIRQTGYAAQAAAVAQGELKPESNITYEAVTMPIRTIAHFTPVARQLIDDADSMRAWIDLELVLGLKDVEDTQILFGDGTGANLRGIASDPGIQTYDWSAGKVGDTKIDAIRRSITKITVTYFDATAVILNPFDWEDIETTKTSFGQYVWINPVVGGEKQLWRLNVVETTAMPLGEFLVGAFDRGVTLWDRESAGVRIADQHADYFLRNQYAILAEERLALTVPRPEAFVLGAFDNAPAS